MTRQYAPKAFLRHVPLPITRALFEKLDVPLALDWGKVPDGDVEPVFDAWQRLAPANRERAEYVFRQAHDLATTEGVRVLVAEGQFAGRDFADDLNRLDGHHAKTVWVFLHATPVFHTAWRLYHAATLPTRYWRRRADLPPARPDLSPQAVGRFKRAVSEFFRIEQGRGYRVTVDPYDRGERGVWVFAYPDDYTQAYVGHDPVGRLARHPQRPAFEVVYAYQPAAGVLDLYAPGDGRVKDRLEDLFCEHLLNGLVLADRPKKTAYTLDGLIDRAFPLPTDPADRVDEVRVRRLRLTLPGGRRRVILEADPAGPRDDVYDLLDTALDRDHLPLADLKVTQATFSIRYLPADGDGPRALTFDVSWPNSCNLKSRADDERELGERLLRRWGIARG